MDMEHPEPTTMQQESDILVQQSDTMGPLPLDMLALSAENKQLKEDMAKLILEKEELMRAQQINTKISAKNVKHDVYSFCKNIEKKDYKYYTGFPYEQFQKIFKFVVPGNADDEPFQFTRTVSSLKCMGLENSFCLF
ncbi:uncharacterized protein LOC124271534 [Haliotis rubra]|uniref:uncharacterized protein LOC124271534 n=1 Tax=Haliotis rubra TaxID=36100 RepID=UPI001EE55A12|nr:uncharacterized protein LOC124271534 [Haliotis rubra]